MPINPITKRVDRSIDMTGQRFGMWTVVCRAETPPNSVKREARWKVVCDCGNESVATREALISGDTQSCGCLKGILRADQAVRGKRARKKERDAYAKLHKHGMAETSEYGIWCSMKQRCTNPHNPAYARYGGRGVTMCDRWLETFNSFYADMGPRPSPDHSIDRINNDLGYSPENCRWATWLEQQNNRSTNHLVTYDGRTLTLLEWSVQTGIPVKLLRSRLQQGMSPEKILSPGFLPKNPKK